MFGSIISHWTHGFFPHFHGCKSAPIDLYLGLSPFPGCNRGKWRFFYRDSILNHGNISGGDWHPGWGDNPIYIPSLSQMGIHHRFVFGGPLPGICLRNTLGGLFSLNAGNTAGKITNFLGGGFIFFVIFTPIWGNDQIWLIFWVETTI